VSDFCDFSRDFSSSDLISEVLDQTKHNIVMQTPSPISNILVHETLWKGIGSLAMIYALIFDSQTDLCRVIAFLTFSHLRTQIL
jgi:hypothetical protein